LQRRDKNMKVVKLIMILIFIASQIKCVKEGDDNTMQSQGKVGAIESYSGETIQLRFTADKVQVFDGDCTNLTLEGRNNTNEVLTWKDDWILEQKGHSAPFDESFPRSSISIYPQKTVKLIGIRLCHADLKGGTYQYRIKTSPASPFLAVSNWVIIHVNK
jgi:hypothetical protein